MTSWLEMDGVPLRAACILSAALWTACGAERIDAQDAGADRADAAAGASGSTGIGGSAGSGGSGAAAGAASGGGEGGASAAGGSSGQAGRAGSAGAAGEGSAGFGANGVPGDCSLTTGDATCDACAQTECSDSCTAAEDHPEAEDYVACTSACLDQGCMDACDAQFADAAARFSIFYACIGAECSCECGGYCDPCGLTTGDDDCDSCMKQHCGGECVEVSLAMDLNDYLECFQECTDVACTDVCDEAYPEAAALFAALETCLDMHCDTLCDL